MSGVRYKAVSVQGASCRFGWAECWRQGLSGPHGGGDRACIFGERQETGPDAGPRARKIGHFWGSPEQSRVICKGFVSFGLSHRTDIHLYLAGCTLR